MKALRYTIAWLLLVIPTVLFGSKFEIYTGISKIDFLYAIIGICILIGITELIEIFEDIKNKKK